ncbi:MAG: hypothetical protein [Cotesia congregata filamentous virus 2]
MLVESEKKFFFRQKYFFIVAGQNIFLIYLIYIIYYILYILYSFLFFYSRTKRPFFSFYSLVEFLSKNEFAREKTLVYIEKREINGGRGKK